MNEPYILCSVDRYTSTIEIVCGIEVAEDYERNIEDHRATRTVIAIPSFDNDFKLEKIPEMEIIEAVIENFKEVLNSIESDFRNIKKYQF